MRIKMTRGQSIQMFGNPYGDDANMFVTALNAAYLARMNLAQNTPIERVETIDDIIKKSIQYLESHKAARPWQFDSINLYSYIDLSHNNWEGRYSNF